MFTKPVFCTYVNIDNVDFCCTLTQSYLLKLLLYSLVQELKCHDMYAYISFQNRSPTHLIMSNRFLTYSYTKRSTLLVSEAMVDSE
jgi:hypothetical protein